MTTSALDGFYFTCPHALDCHLLELLVYYGRKGTRRKGALHLAFAFNVSFLFLGFILKGFGHSLRSTVNFSPQPENCPIPSLPGTLANSKKKQVSLLAPKHLCGGTEKGGLVDAAPSQTTP